MKPKRSVSETDNQKFIPLSFQQGDLNRDYIVKTRPDDPYLILSSELCEVRNTSSPLYKKLQVPLSSDSQLCLPVQGRTRPRLLQLQARGNLRLQDLLRGHHAAALQLVILVLVCIVKIDNELESVGVISPRRRSSCTDSLLMPIMTHLL